MKAPKMEVLIALWAGCSAGLWAQLIDQETKGVRLEGILAKIGSTEAFQQQPLLLQANVAMVVLLSALVAIKVYPVDSYAVIFRVNLEHAGAALS